jgi:nuclear transport factor 2 (NTF2) superfamily protein
MHTVDAAERWRRTWQDAWPRHDTDAIAALYAAGTSYRNLAFRAPHRGVGGAREYLVETFTAERSVVCQFGEPVVHGSRAAVEWWASWVEDGRPLTLAGATILRFDDDGLVTDHRDYWNQQEDRVEPYPGW